MANGFWSSGRVSKLSLYFFFRAHSSLDLGGELKGLSSHGSNKRETIRSLMVATTPIMQNEHNDDNSQEDEGFYYEVSQEQLDAVDRMLAELDMDEQFDRGKAGE